MVSGDRQSRTVLARGILDGLGQQRRLRHMPAGLGSVDRWITALNGDLQRAATERRLREALKLAEAAASWKPPATDRVRINPAAGIAEGESPANRPPAGVARLALVAAPGPDSRATARDDGEYSPLWQRHGELRIPGSPPLFTPAGKRRRLEVRFVARPQLAASPPAGSSGGQSRGATGSEHAGHS